MKITYFISVLISLISFFTSCVGEDVFFVEVLNNSVSFDRQLRSIAEDEEFAINVVFRDSINQVIENESEFTVIYSSDDETILEISQEGIITPVNNGTTIIRVNASLGDVSLPEIEDEITVGKVTLSESEAQLKNNEEEVSTIIRNGYTPEITITNQISKIGIDSQEDIQLKGIYQNLKKQIIDVVLTWESDDSSILEVNNDGILIPISTGITTITASFNNIESTLEIEVTEDDSVVVIEEDPVETTEVIGFGMLQSNSSYDVQGNFQIIKENGVTTLILDETYSSSSREALPDLVIYLSNATNTNNGASFISEDITKDGEQSFIIPDSINPDDYINVLIYCRRFGQRVGFGVINR